MTCICCWQELSELSVYKLLKLSKENLYTVSIISVGVRLEGKNQFLTHTEIIATVYKAEFTPPV